MHRGMERQLRPGGQGCALEIGDGVEAHTERMAFLVELDAGHERRLVLGAAAGFAAVNTAEHGVIGHDPTAQHARGLALGHGFQELVLDTL